MNNDLAWMSRPFAHRGLHDAGKGIIENTRSSVRAAIEGGYGIEVDVRAASCGSIMVFHDDRLERLTHATGLIADKSKDELQKIDFRGTSDKMMSLLDVLELVESKVPLLLEIKSNWQNEPTETQRFVNQMVADLQGYRGDYGVMSFDPAFISTFRKLAPEIRRGLISERFANLHHWHQLSFAARMSHRFLLSFPHSRPDFIAYDINALPALAPLIARNLFNRPLATWTVRNDAQKKRAKKYCDAMIFEGFSPLQGKTGSAR